MNVAGFLAEPGRPAQVAAVSPSGLPLLGSLWFCYADGRFWFSSHPSSPLVRAAAAGRPIAVIVDRFDPPSDIRQVRVRGPGTVEPPDPARVTAIYSRYLGDGEWPEFFRTRVSDPDWILWTVRPASGVVTDNPGFRAVEQRWSTAADAPPPFR